MEEIEQTGQEETEAQPLPEENVVVEAKPAPEKEAAAKTGSVPVESEDEASAKEGIHIPCVHRRISGSRCSHRDPAEDPGYDAFRIQGQN